MTATETVCAVVNYLPDGSALTNWWVVDSDLAAQVFGVLGEPTAQTVTTAEQMDTDDDTAGPAPILWRPVPAMRQPPPPTVPA